ncbi:iron-sulfur cluster assembly scaffold protein [Telmatospirillum siberiense]|uniref:Iron-sulfur cluster assembly scaffold protein n=1 Tax=Telmatospirillum siberiense TaxID=382514 RepID=A0A2N3PQH0_9PROT|nr:iron-sulfur cluster assembly scaffold protein [Telmatospirillum siberiense]PKU22634.1 iron-sulfur cluster assembly scaffold protein [Telmatospirillum siberiense]
MSDDIYHAKIKALAQVAHGAGPLAEPQGRAVIDNPLCGDRASVSVALAEDGTIAALAHEIRGCLLCRASASALAEAAQGLAPERIAEARRALEHLLRDPETTGDTFAAQPTFTDFEAFRPVHRHKSRHDCVLLPFRATEKALAEAARQRGLGRNDPVAGAPS